MNQMSDYLMSQKYQQAIFKLEFGLDFQDTINNKHLLVTRKDFS